MAKTRFAKWWDRTWGKHSEPDPNQFVEHCKQQVYEHVRDTHNNVVAYGPFKGMNLGAHAWWGSHDRTGKILGTYERHIVDHIAQLPREQYHPFIDIGASDGYFAVGAIASGLFNQVIAFEIAADGRNALAQVAATNNVQIDIRELADETSLAILAAEHDTGAILIDIEGAEYDLLTDKVLNNLRNFHITIELHDMFKPDGTAMRDRLLRDAGKYFHCEILRPGPIPASDFRELDHFNDDMRMLAFSENRGGAMEWLTLTPLT